MLFAATLRAQPGIAEIRARCREAHDAYWSSRLSSIWLAGPLLSDNGDRIGQIMIVEADGPAAAARLIGDDPYVVNGCFEPFTVSSFRPSVREGSAT